MKEKILLLFLMMNVYGIASFAQTREPDNTISDAKYLPINTVLKDSVNYPNVSDFHKAILPKSGSGILKVILKATSANGNGGTIGYRLWSKTGKELANKIFNLPANKTLSATDSTVYYSYQLDTCYIEIYDVNTSSSFPKNYEIKYEESPLTHSDIESNDQIADALALGINSIAQGLVGFQQQTQGQYKLDVSDFYRVTLPLNGSNVLKVTLKATSVYGNGGTIGYRLWSKTGKELANKIFNLPANKALSAKDSTVYYSYQLDTCYIQVYDFNANGNYPKTYEIKYEESPLTHSDTESNDQIADALALGVNTIAQGLVGFQQQTQGQYKLDVSDFYRVTLPLNGSNVLKVTLKATSVSGNGGTIGYRLWSKTGKELANKIFNLPANKTLSATDSTVYYSYQLDTCYIQVYDFNASGTYPKTYEIKYEESPLTHSDTESNDQIADALALGVNTIAQGLVGFQQQTQGQYKLDVSDFYRVTLPLNGNNVLKVNLKATSVSGNGGTIGYRLWSKTGKELVNKTFGLPTNKTLSATDSTVYYSSQLDTCYIQVYDFNANGNYPKTYVLRCENRNIITGFDAVQYNNDITIINKSNGDSFLWDFGDGSPKSNMKLPVHTYTKVGDFIVTQQVMVNGTTLKVEETKIVSVRGVESYTPKEAGAGGDVAITIYGGGLRSGTGVKLINGSEVLTAENTTLVAPGMLFAPFDLHLAKEGVYDISIEQSGYPAIVIPKGFTIEKYIYPQVVSSIEGYNTLRTGRKWRYNLNLTNTGNVVANGVQAYLAVPEGVNIEILMKRNNFFPDSTATYDFSNSQTGENFHYTFEDIKKQIMIDRENEIIPVDSLFGKPFKGKVYPISFQYIMPHATISVPFYAESTTAQNRLEASMTSFVTPINLFGSCETPEGKRSEDAIADILFLIADNIPQKAWESAGPVGATAYFISNSFSIMRRPLGGLAKFGGALWSLQNDDNVAGTGIGKWWNQINLRLNQAYDIAYGGAYGNATYEEQMADAKKRLILSGPGLIKSVIPAVKDVTINQAKLQQSMIFNERLRMNSLDMYNLSSFSRYSALLKTTEERLATTKRIAGWMKASDYIKYANTLNDQWLRYNKIRAGEEKIPLLDIYINDNCPPYHFKNREQFLKWLEDNSGKDNDFWKNLIIGNSVDPNEMVGNKGYGVQNHILGHETMNYTVRFENKPDAGLAAQIVNVYDTLDVNKFDLETFEFSSIIIGERILPIMTGRKTIFFDYDMRPAQDLITRVCAKLDTLTGIVHWQFVTLDPVTNDLTNNPEAGFLPPNKNYPEGEGSVSFNVKLKDLPDGTAITNRADIRFDFNDPILTNVWLNTIDKNAPDGKVSNVTQTSDSTFTINWQGTDQGSNIRYYELYASLNNRNFYKVGNFSGTQLDVSGQVDSLYSFYVIPVDSVGNMQVKSATAEGSIKLVGKENNQDEAVIFYPNPNKANNAFNMRVNTSDSGELEVFFYDIMGHLIGSQKLEHEGGTRTYTLNDLSLYTRGMYLGRVKLNGKDLKTVKLLVN